LSSIEIYTEPATIRRMKRIIVALDDSHLLEEVRPLYEDADPAHDLSHIMRVCRNVQVIGEREGADMQVLLLAALLHDAGSCPKHANGGKTEAISGCQKIADDFLVRKGIAEEVRKKVLYAIEVHSFSRGIAPATLEAAVLQDADRLDAIGAIGIARVFLTGGSMNRELYNPEDPFCRDREPDDERWNLDHFYRKLLRLESGMHTETARTLARERSAVMIRYLADLQKEIEGDRGR
jgi:uncharacterized protein